MRKLIIAFVVIWAGFCLVITGQTVFHPNWRQLVRQDPEILQDNAGDIFNQGARQLKNQAHKLTPVTTLVRDESESVSALPIVYWLYPIKFEFVNATATKDVFKNPKNNSVIFVGPKQAFLKNEQYIDPAYFYETIKEAEDKIFVVIKK